jgi:hypothetical protein
VPEEMAAVLRALNQLCYCVCFFTLFVTYFVRNVSATVSYDQKELLDTRTAITHPVLKEYLFFNESDRKDLLQPPDKTLIPVIRRRDKYRGRRSRCLVRIWQWAGNLPLPSVLLANIQSMEIKIDELQSHMSYQQDIKNEYLMFHMNKIQQAGFKLFRQERTAASGKRRAGCLCIL